MTYKSLFAVYLHRTRSVTAPYLTHPCSQTRIHVNICVHTYMRKYVCECPCMFAYTHVFIYGAGFTIARARGRDAMRRTRDGVRRPWPRSARRAATAAMLRTSERFTHVFIDGAGLTIARARGRAMLCAACAMACSAPGRGAALRANEREARGGRAARPVFLSPSSLSPCCHHRRR